MATTNTDGDESEDEDEDEYYENDYYEEDAHLVCVHEDDWPLNCHECSRRRVRVAVRTTGRKFCGGRGL